MTDNQEHALRELNDTLADQFELTDAERQQLLPSVNQAVMVNRVDWARTYLKNSGFIK